MVGEGEIIEKCLRIGAADIAMEASERTNELELDGVGTGAYASPLCYRTRAAAAPATYVPSSTHESKLRPPAAATGTLARLLAWPHRGGRRRGLVRARMSA